MHQDHCRKSCWLESHVSGWPLLTARAAPVMTLQSAVSQQQMNFRPKQGLTWPSAAARLTLSSTELPFKCPANSLTLNFDF